MCSEISANFQKIRQTLNLKLKPVSLSQLPKFNEQKSFLFQICEETLFSCFRNWYQKQIAGWGLPPFCWPETEVE